MIKIYQVVRNVKDFFRIDSGKICRGYKTIVYDSYFDYDSAFKKVEELNRITGSNFYIREL